MGLILELNNVNKRFGGVVAANNVTFEVEKGKIKGLIGPNGAGKTTLLNLISGIYDVDDGKIIFDGQEVTNVPAHKRARMGIGRTFQTPRFLDRSSIEDNLKLGTDLFDQMGYINSFFGKKGSDYQHELEDLMEIVGFEVNWDDEISSIPYGQRKMLEIVRCLLSYPKVMLVDEPAAGLNKMEIERVVDLLNLGISRDIGIVLIEHRMDLVMSVCSSITVLNFGQVICDSIPEEVVNNEEVIEAYLGRQD